MISTLMFGKDGTLFTGDMYGNILEW